MLANGLAPDELIIDNFAGGGGASLGLEWAFGRPVDVAINHDPEAVALHKANHPDTLHLCQSVWKADPREVVAEISRRKGSLKPLPVGVAWFSPDCAHFSKAKGSKPVKKNVRDLAWVVVLWARLVKPRVIMLENVEEFRKWGPLIIGVDGKLIPCPLSKGLTFKRWDQQLRRLGYKTAWKEIRASNHGSATIRNRLYYVARRDGLPIDWPEHTHSKLGDGGLPKWRAAYEIIDWTRPCHSIFLSREEGRKVRVKRPLVEATMARIAKGVKRFVIDAANPFIVQVNHGDSGGRREHPITDPLGTVETANSRAIVQPYIVPVTHRGDLRVHDGAEPLRTLTTAHGGELALVAPVIVNTANSKTTGRGPNTWPPDEPVRTITASGSHAVVEATLSAPFIAKHNRGATGSPITAPMPTITANSFIKRPGAGGPLAVVMPYLVPRYGEREGQEPRTRSAELPLPTDVPKGNGASVVAAFLAQHNGGVVGREADKPLSTITAGGTYGTSQQAVVSAHLLNMKGSKRSASSIEDPVPTICAGAGHAAEVRAFLVKYYSGEGGDDGHPQGQALDGPLHTITAKPRFGLVTVHGEPWEIVDIGMRMLTPRERYNAQGFPPDYRIDIEFNGKRLSQDAQGRMCGNSVPPPVVHQIAVANLTIAAAAAAGAGDD